MGPTFGDVMMAIVCMGIPSILIFTFMRRWFALKEKRIEADMMMAAEKAAQYVSGTDVLEQRVRVLEQIVTDGSYSVASQIEQLRDPQPALIAREMQR